MQIQSVTPQIKPPAASNGSARSQAPKFGANQPQIRFGANSENPGILGAIGSFFSYIGRTLGRMVGLLHAEEDKRVATDPAAAKAALKAELDTLIEKRDKVVDGLRDVIANVAKTKKAYEDALRAEAQEKEEFQTAGEMLNEAEENEVNKEDKEYLRLKTYTEQQFAEWKEAEEKLQGRKNDFEEAQKMGTLAKSQIEELNAAIDEKARKNQTLINKVYETQAREMQHKLRQQLEASLGLATSLDTGSQLAADIEHNYEKAKVGYDGKTLDEKMEELAFKRKMANKTAAKKNNAEMEAALASLKKDANTETGKAAQSASTGSTPKTSGQIVEEDAAPPKK